MYLLYYVRAIHVAQDLQISIMLNYRITALMCRLLYLYCYSFALLYCCADILDFTSQSHGGQILVCRLIYSKSKICHRPMCEIRNERQNLIQNRKSILRDHNWDFALSFCFCASVIISGLSSVIETADQKGCYKHMQSVSQCPEFQPPSEQVLR